jgi:hypothetical protein
MPAGLLGECFVALAIVAQATKRLERGAQKCTAGAIMHQAGVGKSRNVVKIGAECSTVVIPIL